ncbi:MAG: hypothetical protein HQK54_03215 [Oligoflexales bacterium]|nr:hypothetical protein [Oligoflexales bacterium]
MVLEKLISNSSKRSAASEIFDKKIAIDSSVMCDYSSNIDSIIEKILEWVNENFGSSLFINGKEEFFWKTGKVFNDDLIFNERMNYFIDCFIFQRLLEVTNPRFLGKTPFTAFMESDKAKDDMLKLSGARHSIFLVLKKMKNSILVKDLLNSNRFQITLREKENIVYAMEPKILFQGHVYFFSGQYFLSHGLLFHPRKVLRIIKKIIKNAKTEINFYESVVLSHLAKLELKYQRHRHIDPKSIYLSETF